MTGSIRRVRWFEARRAPLPASIFVLLLLTAASVEAATVHKCTSPNGRTTFSDQPCPSDEEADEVTVEGQPLIGGKVPSGEATPATPNAPGAAAETEPEQDERAPRLRRLDHLLNQLLSAINRAGESCDRATTGINGWIDRHGKEARGLLGAWDEIRYEKLLLKQKEMEAMRTKLQRQLARLKNVSLPKLNAKCWADKKLGAAFDRLQPYLPGN